MKPLGVRLAAGAVTILLGVFAVAQTQKDRDSSESWEASQPESLQQTPAPIAQVDGEPWLEQPTLDTDTSPAQSSRRQESAIQLVQHTSSEDAGNTGVAADSNLELPAVLVDTDTNPTNAAANDSVSLVPDWTMPAEAGNTANLSDTPEMAMELPASLGPPESLPTQTLPSGAAVGATGPATLALPPTVEVPVNPNAMTEANPVGNAQPSSRRLPTQGASPQSAPTPSSPATNILRASPEGTNLLRDPPAVSISTPAPADTGLTISNPIVNTTPIGEGSLPVTVSGDAAPRLAPSPTMQSPTPTLAIPAGQLTGQPAGQLTGQPASQTTTLPAQNVLSQPQQVAPQIASLPRESAAAETTSPAYQPSTLSIQSAALPGDRSDQTQPSPGDRRLEGVQSPSIVIQKRAPGEVQVGKPASFVIQVKNVGSVEALDVVVADQVPMGMRLVDASPAPIVQGDKLHWQLGSMAAGDERTVTMQLIPEQEGELGSVARVTFEAAASVRIIATRPELKIVQRAPEKVLIGQQLEIELEVSNPGTGAATGVLLQEDVPVGLEHPEGRKLDNAIGTLAPGETRRQMLRLRAVTPGLIQNQIRLVADDGLTSEHTIAVEVVAPQLSVDLSGPAKRYLERQATYQVEFANTGTATATNVEIVVQLDRGFSFVSTENQGQYDPNRHAVFWSLVKLEPGQQASVPLTLLPVEVGNQAIQIEATADLDTFAENKREISVDAFAQLSFQIRTSSGPIEVGSETVYEVRVQNDGSKNDSNVQLQVQLPAGLELVSVDGDAGTDGRGLVVFQPIARLDAGQEKTYRLRVRGVQPGTQIVKAAITSDQSDVPVTKEESTRVYSDQ